MILPSKALYNVNSLGRYLDSLRYKGTLNTIKLQCPLLYNNNYMSDIQQADDTTFLLYVSV
jgi:hypothetical protein